ITLPPLPVPAAEASIMVAASIDTVPALATAYDSRCALALPDARLVLGWPPPQSPPIRTVPPPAWPEALIVAPVTSIFSPVIWIVPPRVPLLLPAADRRPDTFTFWFGTPVAAPSTIMPLWLPIVLASITPELLMTESTI